MTNDTETRTARIPFAGFCNSWHDDALDRALESCFQDDCGEPTPACDVASDAVDWQSARLAYAQLYCSTLAQETGATWEFAALDSPRFYNFRTDEIDVTVTLPELHRMLDVIDPAALQSLATDRLTARSGFIPSYSSDVAEWGALETWESPLLGLLIETYCDAMDQNAESRDCWLVDDCNGELSRIIESAIPQETWDKINAMESAA